MEIANEISSATQESHAEEQKWRIFRRNALFLYDIFVLRERPSQCHTVQWSDKPIWS